MFTLGDIYRRNARHRPRHPAVIVDGRVITHRDLYDAACRAAGMMRRLGVARGDRVALLAQNGPEYLTAYAAGDIGGWATVTVNFRLAAAEIDYILADSQPQVLVVDAGLLDRVSAAARSRLAHIVTIGGRGPDLDWDAAMAASSAEDTHEPVEPGDTASLVYTSGTTGRPKGVMLSHRGQLQAAQIVAIETGTRPTDVLALAMPLYHIGGRNLWVKHASLGSTVILHRAFRPGDFYDSLRRHRATTTLLAPTMLSDLVEETGADSESLPHLRQVLYSAAPMPEALLRRLIDRLGPVFGQVYGMTESGGPGTALRAEDHVLDGPPRLVRRLRSAGQAMIGCDVRIVRPDGEACGIAEPGEIVIRSPALMTGYWQNAAATTQALRDGWLHTGDIGEADEEGFVFVVDRLKEMIVSGGENIYSREVENALASHADVLEAAVVGGPDPRWGEVVVAFVAPRPGANPATRELIEHCRSTIAAYKRPRAVHIVDALPRLPNGKVEKYKLRARLWQGQDRVI